jgi:hypothetical protein
MPLFDTGLLQPTFILVFLGAALFFTGVALVRVIGTFWLWINMGQYDMTWQLWLYLYAAAAGVFWCLFFASLSDIGWTLVGVETGLSTIALAIYPEQRVTLQHYLSRADVTIPILSLVLLAIVAWQFNPDFFPNGTWLVV